MRKHKHQFTTDAHLKDLKASNIQHTNEKLSLGLGLQSLVDTGNQPVEHLGIKCLGQGSHSIGDLIFGLTLGHIVVTNLHLGLEHSLKEITSIDSHQVSNLLSLLSSISLSLLLTGSLLELHLSKVKYCSSALVHTKLLTLGEAKNVKGLLQNHNIVQNIMFVLL